uniref:PLAT domain-containing protein n=1 Tax=Steinernema glaseri TaxID=37863 RepID=A0A1I7ZHH9_9BILA
VGLHAQDGRTFKDAKLSINVVQHTADCYEAGTDCDVTITFGYRDADATLRYKIATPAQKGSVGNHFERNTKHEFSHNVTDEEFKTMEQACTDLATNSSGFDEPTYDRCFNVNIIYYQTYTWWGNIGADWKPGKTVATFSFTLSDGSKQKRVVEFKPLVNCYDDWIAGGKNYFMCHNFAVFYTGGSYQYMPQLDKLNVGETVSCIKKD